jgi:ankyrin repeat protein
MELETTSDADELVQMARYGEEEDLVAMLASHSAEGASFVNHQNEWGQSALACACANGHVGIVTALLGAGADVNLANKEGNSALHWACLMGQLAIVKLLVDSGRVDLNLRNRLGRTPLDEAYDRGHSAVFDFLAELSATPGKAAMEACEAENQRAEEEGDGKEEE